MEHNEHYNEENDLHHEFYNYIEDFRMLLQIREELHKDIQNVLLDTMNDADVADAMLSAIAIYNLVGEYDQIEHHIDTYFQKPNH